MPGKPFTPSDLIAALSLTVDVQRHGNLYHGWRVAITAYAMASELTLKDRTYVFYAGLLHDVGSVGAAHHVTCYPQLNQQMADAQIKAHPDRGAALIRSIPGLSVCAGLVASHHEWWNGEGYPDALRGEQIPIGAQFIRIADSADIGHCFDGSMELKDALTKLHGRTGIEWSKDAWATFLRVFTDGTLPRGIMKNSELYGFIRSISKDLLSLPELKRSESLESIFLVFAKMVDSKSNIGSGHSERVAFWAVTIGQAMALSESELQMLRWVAYVHDAGHIALPKAVLDKTDRLSKDELDMVRSHPELTGEIFRIIEDSHALAELADIASHHHERYDGQGYPDGLMGDSIPKLARVLAVADAYDAMTSLRPHRQAMMPGVAIQRLQLNAGSQFDPEIVDAVVDLYNRNQSKFLAA